MTTCSLASRSWEAFENIFDESLDNDYVSLASSDFVPMVVLSLYEILVVNVIKHVLLYVTRAVNRSDSAVVILELSFLIRMVRNTKRATSTEAQQHAEQRQQSAMAID
ncbi:hypothetical protein QE152_g35589 [Popillia japonica]|uniref:Uncharacterized protein n=1 Tax=Popillia japonica TaxID=7064 RepID=A0AAW1IFH9_POPJA